MSSARVAVASAVEEEVAPDLLSRPEAAIEVLGTENYLHSLLYDPAAAPVLDPIHATCKQQSRLLESFGLAAPRGDAESLRIFHSTLYRLYTAQLAVPWEQPAINGQHPLFFSLRRGLEAAWSECEGEQLGDVADGIPGTPDAFCEYVSDYISSHRSSAMHALFPFLRDEANLDQLREFHYQETPLDIRFSDLLCLMIAGLTGPIRAELARNLWDEVGRGDPERSHVNLRLRMMRHLGISGRIHLDAIDTFVWEELALANLYFRAAFNRCELLQAVGIMLATEMAVPGRLECQLEGFRRVGLSEESIEYLTEHVTVDVYHAMGWMDEVVRPIIRDRFDLAPKLMQGVAGRLELAALVCDRMLNRLRAMTV